MLSETGHLFVMGVFCTLEYSIFMPFHKKYSQSEYTKAVVCDAFEPSGSSGRSLSRFP